MPEEVIGLNEIDGQQGYCAVPPLSLEVIVSYIVKN